MKITSVSKRKHKRFAMDIVQDDHNLLLKENVEQDVTTKNEVSRPKTEIQQIFETKILEDKTYKVKT